MNHILYSLFLYTVACSVVTVHGFGFERSFFESSPSARFYVRLPSTAVSLLTTVSIMWYPLTRALIPLGYVFLAPVLTALVYGAVGSVMTMLAPKANDAPSGERAYLFGSMYLALFEATSLVDSLTICLASLAAFSLVTVLLLSIRERIAPASIRTEWRGSPIIHVTKGLIALAFYGADVSWWFSGGIR